MIWVITSENSISGEAAIIQQLLEAGANRVLLRKPGWDARQQSTLLEQIEPVYHRRIMIRDNCWLYKTFRLNGVHWSGNARSALTPLQLQKWVSNHPCSSTGVHSQEEIKENDGLFNYLLCSPVFNSISKPGYSSRFEGTAPRAQYSKLIALGGVSAANAAELPRRNFSGAAVLGAIWQQPARAVERYLEIQKQWDAGAEKSNSHDA